jgi:hypothetical protein
MAQRTENNELYRISGILHRAGGGGGSRLAGCERRKLKP